MKLTCVLLTVCLLHASAKVVSQQVSFSGQNVPLTSIFPVVEKQTGFVFIYTEARVRLSKPVSIDAKNVPLEKFLDEVFKSQSLRYSIKGKNILISLKPGKGSVNVPHLSEGYLQPPVSFRVTDSLGNPLAGATVTIAGTSKTAITDRQGGCTIDAEPGAQIFISYVGFEPVSYHVQDNIEDVTIILKQSRKIEEEVVVSTGYQYLPRERVAGSFGKVNQATLEKRSNFNILSYLEGQVAGLLTSSDGQIAIRGQSTINGNKAPLIVLDGFPIERPVETINAVDIESVTVLRDASAASIWGVRAANGVIVIQTKRGMSSRKPLDINFTSTLSVTPVSDLSDLPFTPVSSFIEFEKYRVDNNLTFFTGIPRPAISPVVDAYLNHSATADQLVNPLKNINAYNEFRDQFMGPATRQQYTIAISGKGLQSSHRASFSFDKVNQEFRNNVTERFVGDLFESVALTRSLHADFGLNVVINNRKDNGMSLGDLRNLLPYQRLLGADGEYLVQPQTFYQADKEAFVGMGYPYNWNYNMVQEFRNKDNKTNSTNINAVARINYQFNKQFSANVGYQYESGNANTNNLLNEETYFVRDLVNYSTSINNNALVTGIPKGSIFRENLFRFYSHTLRGQLKYESAFDAGKHFISAIAGTEVRELGSNVSSQTKYGYDPQSLQFARVDYTRMYTDVRGSQRLIPDETIFRDTLNRFVSYYGNAGYTLFDKYTLNASARLDKTNLFGATKDYRDVWLWSAGLSWKLHRENFFPVKSVFNSLIVRTTYGINGNVDKSSSPFLIANVATDQQTNQPYAYVANPQNPLLRWEKTTVTNLGIDFSMLNNRLKGSLEYYNRLSDDLLGDATVNGTYGFNSAVINYASMRNKGVDISLSGLIIDRQFKWYATLNYSYNKNNVIKVDFPQETVGSYLASIPQAGKPLNYLFSYQWAGLSAEGWPQVFDENKTPVNYTTDMENTLAMLYEGSSIPPHYGALINEFSFKGFSVLVNFTYKMGHMFRVPVIQYQSLFDNNLQLHKDWDSRWKQPGDEARTNTPVAPVSVTGLNVYDKYTKYANINVETASHIRFRELLINYTLPAKLFRTATSPVSIGLQARNLAVITFNKADLDPEYLTVDRNNIVLPLRPEFSFIIRANF